MWRWGCMWYVFKAQSLVTLVCVSPVLCLSDGQPVGKAYQQHAA